MTLPTAFAFGDQVSGVAAAVDAQDLAGDVAGLLAGEERARGRDVLGLPGTTDGRRRRKSGAVDEDGGTAELRHYVGDGRLDRRAVGDVDPTAERLAAVGCDRRRRRLGSIAVQIEDGDLAAVSGESIGDGAPDS